MSRLVPLCITSAVLWHREVLLPAISQAMLWVVLPMQKYLEIHRKIAHRRRKHFSQSSNATKQEQAQLSHSETSSLPHLSLQTQTGSTDLTKPHFPPEEGGEEGLPRFLLE